MRHGAAEIRRERRAVPLPPGSPTRAGVLWDYPAALHRRLFTTFTALLGLGSLATLLLHGELDPFRSIVDLVPVALAIVASLYVGGLIGVTERPLPRLRLDWLFAAVGTSCLVLGAGCAVLPGYAPPPGPLCTAPAIAAAFVYLRRKWMETHERGGPLPVAVLADARASAARALARLRGLHGVEARAVVLTADAVDRAPVAGLPPRPADPASLEALRREGVRLLVVADAGPDLGALLPWGAGAGYVVETLPDLVARAEGRLALDSHDDLALMTHISRQVRPRPVERCVDVVLASALLLLSLPAWLVVALLVKLSSPGPILYRQVRVGRWGRPFTILKFRTMRADAERESGPVWSPQGDPRIHRIGRFLRSSRLDELPQLWNVLRGDMSLVGPRPERPCFVNLLSERIALYPARHAVRPGLTGWAQVRYPYGASEEDSREKLAYDLFYIRNRSLAFYFAVLIETTRVLFFRRGGR
jgi:lipopolysaccharide/colanic/teichoic acid biosynthesis glycosyltransferase